MTDSLSAIAADYRDLLARVDAFAADHRPGAIWRRARRAALTPRARRWTARALDLDPEPTHNVIALSGMAPLLVDDRWHVAVAWPQPEPGTGLTTPDDVVLIDPATNTAAVLGDAGVAMIAPAIRHDRISVTADPKAWARAIALDRLEWWRCRADRERLLQAPPAWSGQPPHALILVPPKRVPWRELDAAIIDVPPDLRTTVHRAVLAQARLPRIEGRA